MQSSKVKAGQLWGKNKDELAKQLEELKLELNQLRVQKISSGASTKTQRMCVSDTPDRFVVRKEIWRFAAWNTL